MESAQPPPGTILHEVWHEDKVVVTAMGPYGVFTAEIDARKFKSWKDCIEYTKIHPLCRWGEINPVTTCKEWKAQEQERADAKAAADEQAIRTHQQEFEKRAAERRAIIQAWNNQP